MNIIQHNMAAMYSSNRLNMNDKLKQKNTERLSSGYKINRAADDAAGLTISEKMRAQIRGLDKASSNSIDGINMIQTADGAMSEIHAVLQRMRELAVQAANDTYTEEDRSNTDLEVQGLKEEINRIIHESEFNTIKLFDPEALKSRFTGLRDLSDGIQITDNNKDFSFYFNGEKISIDLKVLMGIDGVADLDDHLDDDESLVPVPTNRYNDYGDASDYPNDDAINTDIRTFSASEVIDKLNDYFDQNGIKLDAVLEDGKYLQIKSEERDVTLKIDSTSTGAWDLLADRTLINPYSSYSSTPYNPIVYNPGFGSSETNTICSDCTCVTIAGDVYLSDSLPIEIDNLSLNEKNSAMVDSDGNLWMWGDNSCSQLLNNTVLSRNYPLKIAEDVVAVSLGTSWLVSYNYSHYAIIKKDGTLWMWGGNNYGQLGDGTIVDKKEPVKIMTDVESVCLGDSYSTVIKKDGSLWMWGNNNRGRLGDGTTVDKIIPVQIMTDVKAVSLGYSHSAIIKNDGSLWMWGDNTYGQLGDGTTESKITPIQVMTDVSSISLGEHHSGAIKKDGSLWMWGDNTYGQLGNKSIINRSTPVKVMDDVISVSLGGYHSGAIKTDGSLWMWGANGSGRLGNGESTGMSNTPIKIMVMLNC